MGQKVVNEFRAASIDLDGSTFNSTSIDFIASIDLLTTASTQLNFTKNTMYFDNNIITAIGAGTSTFVLST